VPGPQYLANLNPEDLDNYYYEQGPPVVTYYEPPEPYYYLYSWVPYPFWSTDFYFPGFFVLNNFHRRLFFNRQPYFVAHHIGGGTFPGPLSITPVNPALPGHLAPKGIAPSRWFAAPHAQTGARAIVMLNRNRPVNEDMTPLNASRPPLSFSGNPTTTAAPRNSPFRPAPEIVKRQEFEQRAYVPSAPKIATPPALIFRPQPTFPYVVHGGGPAVREFHDGGNFPAQGAARGGRR
jgi:hypothetical protein